MNNIHLSVMAIFVATALVGTFVAVGDNMAFAGGHHKHNSKHNIADQAIGQGQSTGQSSGCFSDGNTTASCNNVALSLNLNDGNNALGQR